MTGPTDFDNLSLTDIRRLRKALFERMLFEPVTDPDFERPSAKLRGDPIIGHHRERVGSNTNDSFSGLLFQSSRP